MCCRACCCCTLGAERARPTPGLATVHGAHCRRSTKERGCSRCCCGRPHRGDPRPVRLTSLDHPSARHTYAWSCRSPSQIGRAPGRSSVAGVFLQSARAPRFELHGRHKTLSGPDSAPPEATATMWSAVRSVAAWAGRRQPGHQSPYCARCWATHSARRLRSGLLRSGRRCAEQRLPVVSSPHWMHGLSATLHPHPSTRSPLVPGSGTSSTLPPSSIWANIGIPRGELVPVITVRLVRIDGVLADAAQ